MEIVRQICLREGIGEFGLSLVTRLIPPVRGIIYLRWGGKRIFPIYGIIYSLRGLRLFDFYWKNLFDLWKVKI